MAILSGFKIATKHLKCLSSGTNIYKEICRSEEPNLEKPHPHPVIISSMAFLCPLRRKQQEDGGLFVLCGTAWIESPPGVPVCAVTHPKMLTYPRRKAT